MRYLVIGGMLILSLVGCVKSEQHRTVAGVSQGAAQNSASLKLGEKDECNDKECGPMPGMPNKLCDDGKTTAGPGPCVRDDAGKCGWTIVECPVPPACTAADCGDAPKMADKLCDDGKTTAGPGECVRGADGKCGWTIIECPVPPECTAADCGVAPKMADKLCDDGKTTAGPGECARGDDGKCGWTIIKCPDVPNQNDQNQNDESQNSTNQNDAVQNDANQNSDQCPKDKPLAHCLIDPCTTAKCAKDTVCKADYCGGCFATCQ